MERHVRFTKSHTRTFTLFDFHAKTSDSDWDDFIHPRRAIQFYSLPSPHTKQQRVIDNWSAHGYKEHEQQTHSGTLGSPRISKPSDCPAAKIQTRKALIAKRVDMLMWVPINYYIVFKAINLMSSSEWFADLFCPGYCLSGYMQTALSSGWRCAACNEDYAEKSTSVNVILKSDWLDVNILLKDTTTEYH